MTQTLSPATVAPLPAPPAVPESGGGAGGDRRRRWDRREYHLIGDLGILQGRYELIGGDIVEKMPQKPPHGYVATRLFIVFLAVFGPDFVRGPLPITLGPHDEPEPDAAATNRPAHDFLTRGNPTPADLALVAEASDTTLANDLGAKALLYARAGIAEYWVVDINGRRLVCHRLPSPTGYNDVQVFDEHASVSPLAAPGAAVRVADLLPPLP